jgi:enoyl-CoA hydratase
LKSVAKNELDTAVEATANSIASVSINQLAMQKMILNQAINAAK